MSWKHSTISIEMHIFLIYMLSLFQNHKVSQDKRDVF